MAKYRSFSDKKSVKRIFGTVFTMALVAVFIACFAIALANDIYAFIKPDGAITLSVDTPLSLPEISHMLEDCGVISNPYAFTLYVRSKDKAELLESFVGNAELDRSMSYREILLAINNAK